MNAEKFKEVVILENDREAVGCAELNINENITENKNENKAKNTKAIALDARQIKKINLSQPLFIITDPPRSGMNPETIKEILALQPELIIYVSCNLQQLAKEIIAFTRKKYEIKSTAIFDLFPQTNHCEIIVELVKSNN